MPMSFRRREMLRWAGSTVALGLSSACGGGGSAGGSAPDGAEPIARSWDELTPDNAPATFRNVDRIGPVRALTRGATAPLTLLRHTRSLTALTYVHAGRTFSLQDFMSRTRNAGLLILKGGAIAFESYGLGNTAQSRWTSFSVAKSLTATLYGAALHAAALPGLDTPVTTVLPAAAGTAYDGTTLRQLLRMSSGARWDETYGATNSDITAMSDAILQQQPGEVLEYVLGRPRAATPGTRWNYNSGETHVLGAALARATQSNLCALASQWIWSRAGMEADGYWLLEAPGALELAAANFSATLRDYGRLGLFILREGQVGAQRLLPQGWRDLAGRPDSALTQPGQIASPNGLGYGYQWWALPNSSAFTAQGIFGQFLYIDPAEDLVAVVWSAWATPWDDGAEAELYALLAGVTAALR
jgi:CubicO group peptidase (beta-lactamase class C family)